jgi:hypothetical protein
MINPTNPLIASTSVLLPLHPSPPLHPPPPLHHRTYDPEYQKFKDGITMQTDVIRKVAYAFNGKPITFTCAANFIPIVEFATRTVFNCPQYLSPYLRYPCPKDVSTCAMDYEAKW